jgi:hypothetical protein
VESLGQLCFSGCKSLWAVTFESGSKLSSIDQSAFKDCLSVVGNGTLRPPDLHANNSDQKIVPQARPLTAFFLRTQLTHFVSQTAKESEQSRISRDGRRVPFPTTTFLLQLLNMKKTFRPPFS